MKTICMMRDLYKALAEFEAQFEKEYDLSLNEAMKKIDGDGQV